MGTRSIVSALCLSFYQMLSGITQLGYFRFGEREQINITIKIPWNSFDKN